MSRILQLQLHCNNEEKPTRVEHFGWRVDTFYGPTGYSFLMVCVKERWT